MSKQLYMIEGVTKSMLEHVTNPHDDFSKKPVFKYKDDHFTKVGDITNLDEECLAEIAKENFTYCRPPGFMQKNRFDQYSDVGALIIGKSDEKLCMNLHMQSQKK